MRGPSRDTHRDRLSSPPSFRRGRNEARSRWKAVKRVEVPFFNFWCSDYPCEVQLELAWALTREKPARLHHLLQPLQIQRWPLLWFWLIYGTNVGPGLKAHPHGPGVLVCCVAVLWSSPLRGWVRAQVASQRTVLSVHVGGLSRLVPGPGTGTGHLL